MNDENSARLHEKEEEDDDDDTRLKADVNVND